MHIHEPEQLSKVGVKPTVPCCDGSRLSDANDTRLRTHCAHAPVTGRLAPCASFYVRIVRSCAVCTSYRPCRKPSIVVRRSNAQPYPKTRSHRAERLFLGSTIQMRAALAASRRSAQATRSRAGVWHSRSTRSPATLPRRRERV
jgi:hypothetical protein